MRIGIGITTYNRPEVLEVCKTQILANSFSHNITLYVAEDTDQDRKGVAYRKNECLRALQDCDYIFLFDDDCYPININWINFFIDSGQNHLLFMDKKFHKKDFVELNIYNGNDFVCTVERWSDCGGVFIFLTKEVVKTFGAFNGKYGLYGFEHADYSNRIMGEKNNYPMLKGTDKHIYAKDYSEENFKSSISDSDKNKFFKTNFNKYFNEPQQKYIPL